MKAPAFGHRLLARSFLLVRQNKVLLIIVPLVLVLMFTALMIFSGDWTTSYIYAMY